MEMIQDFVVRQLILIAVNLKVYAVICVFVWQLLVVQRSQI